MITTKTATLSGAALFYAFAKAMKYRLVEIPHDLWAVEYETQNYVVGFIVADDQEDTTHMPFRPDQDFSLIRRAIELHDISTVKVKAGRIAVSVPFSAATKDAIVWLQEPGWFALVDAEIVKVEHSERSMEEAVMRLVVRLNLGEEVEIPDSLKGKVTE